MSQTDNDGMGIASVIIDTNNVSLEIIDWNVSNSEISLNFTGANNQDLSLQVYSALGQLVYDAQLEGGDDLQNHKFSLAQYDQGIYLLRLSNKKETVSLKLYLSK